jgi:hypothetical protein
MKASRIEVVRRLAVFAPQGAVVVIYGSVLNLSGSARDVDIWIGGGSEVERGAAACFAAMPAVDIVLDSDLAASPKLQSALRLIASRGLLIAGKQGPCAPADFSIAHVDRVFRVAHAQSALRLSREAMTEATRGIPAKELVISGIREFERSRAGCDWRAIMRASPRAVLRTMQQRDPLFNWLSRRWDDVATAKRLHSLASLNLKELSRQLPQKVLMPRKDSVRHTALGL